MSILAMTSLAALRAQQNVGRLPAAEAGGFKTAISQLTAYIPTEIIGTYVAALGILSPDSSALKWIVFAVALVLTPVFVAISFSLRKRQTPNLKGSSLAWLIVFATLGFIAWAGALPTTPLLDIPSYSTVIGGIAVIFLAPLFGKLADWLNLAPRS